MSQPTSVKSKSTTALLQASSVWLPNRFKEWYQWEVVESLKESPISFPKKNQSEGLRYQKVTRLVATKSKFEWSWNSEWTWPKTGFAIQESIRDQILAMTGNPASKIDVIIDDIKMDVSEEKDELSDYYVDEQSAG
jgi:hypothetical protein